MTMLNGMVLVPAAWIAGNIVGREVINRIEVLRSIASVIAVAYLWVAISCFVVA
jgi:hypothetical protein